MFTDTNHILSRRPSRLVAAAAAAGTAFVLEALVELAHPQAQPLTSVADYAIEALFAIGLILSAVAWRGIRASGAVDARRGRTGAAIAAGGNAALALSATATLATGADALGPVFMLGLLASLAGGITVATAADGHARALGGALTVGLIASMAIGTGGAAVLGLAWIAVATLLRGPAPALGNATA